MVDSKRRGLCLPHHSLLLLWTRWRFYVCVCVEKAARRAVCQLSAHVVNIRNQTGANRMQVRLGIAFICTNNPQWCLIISHCYISKQLALFWGGEVVTLALIVEEWELTVLIIWHCWFEHGDKCLAYRCSLRVFPACLCEVFCLTVCVLSSRWVMARCPVDRKKVQEAVFVTPQSCYSHSAFVCRYPHF